MLATGSQPEPSAKAPCTRTTFLIFCFTIILLCSKNPLGPIDCRCRRLRTKPPCAERAAHLTVNTYELLVDVCRGSRLFDELGCFLWVRHVGDVAGIHFDRLSIGALRHHAL